MAECPKAFTDCVTEQHDVRFVVLARLVCIFGCRPAVSKLYQGAVGPRLVVAIDVPARGSDGTVTYVLSLILHLEVFAEIIRRQYPPATWVVSSIDPRGVNIARVPDGGGLSRMKRRPVCLPRCRRSRKGSWRAP